MTTPEFKRTTSSKPPVFKRTLYPMPISDFKVTLPPDERPKKVSEQVLPPEDVTLKRGEFWCPYCAQAVSFKVDTKYQILRCPRCGISERDYYVKVANKLWGKKKAK
jgi:hypothetical protein